MAVRLSYSSAVCPDSGSHADEKFEMARLRFVLHSDKIGLFKQKIMSEKNMNVVMRFYKTICQKKDRG